MIKKCEHLDCSKAGTCRCPKDRDLKSYWLFCPKHASEYNKNWNYYAGMSHEDIEKQWEKDTFGSHDKVSDDYSKLVGDFLSGRAKIPPKQPKLPQAVANAMSAFGLPLASTWAAVQREYRRLAKLEHPDTSKSKDQTRFVKINSAYQTLKKHFKK